MKKEKIYSRANKISITSLNQGSKEITFFGRIVYKIESQNFSGNVFISLTGRSTDEIAELIKCDFYISNDTPNIFTPGRFSEVKKEGNGFSILYKGNQKTNPSEIVYQTSMIDIVIGIRVCDLIYDGFHDLLNELISELDIEEIKGDFNTWEW